MVVISRALGLIGSCSNEHYKSRDNEELIFHN